MCLSVCPSVCLWVYFVSLSIYIMSICLPVVSILSVCMSIYPMSICLSILSVCLPTYLSLVWLSMYVYVSVRLSDCLSVYLFVMSICPSVCLSVCMYVWTSNTLRFKVKFCLHSVTFVFHINSGVGCGDNVVITRCLLRSASFHKIVPELYLSAILRHKK